MAKVTATKAAAPKSSTSIVSIQAKIAADVAALASRVDKPSGDTIQVTQDKMFKMPDGTQHPGPLRLVVVDFVAANYFYEGAYDPNNASPPTCFAIGITPTDMSPSANSPEKQAEKCGTCPNNQFGSKGNGKACKNMRVMAVLPPDADANTPMYILKTSPTANKAFDSYVSAVARTFQRPPYGVITEISFDPSEKYATLRFGNPAPADDDLLEVAFNRQAEARERLLTEPDVSGFEAPKPAARKAGRR